MFVLWTNLVLIKFVFMFCFCMCFFVFVIVLQMSPIKQLVSKKSTKRSCTNSENFQSVESNMAYNDYYKRASIIMEKVVAMETLENTFIPKVFKERTWAKLLNPVGNVYA